MLKGLLVIRVVEEVVQVGTVSNEDTEVTVTIKEVDTMTEEMLRETEAIAETEGMLNEIGVIAETEDIQNEIGVIAEIEDIQSEIGVIAVADETMTSAIDHEVPVEEDEVAAK